MSNRKKARMDAIERRLADLEQSVFGDGPKDDAPDWLREHGWRPVEVEGHDQPCWYVYRNGTRHETTQHYAIEAQQGWNRHADPPEFSCRPEYEPDDDRVIRERAEADDGPRSGWEQRTDSRLIDAEFRLGIHADQIADLMEPQPECLQPDSDLVPPPPSMEAGDEWRWSFARGWRRVVPDDVRERARERSDLADATAARKAYPENVEWQVICDQREYWERTAARYETSLRALLGRTILSADAREADLYALIEGCLAGGTITPSGLRDG